MFLNFIITTLILYKINSQNYNEYKSIIGIYGNHIQIMMKTKEIYYIIQVQ